MGHLVIEDAPTNQSDRIISGHQPRPVKEETTRGGKFSQVSTVFVNKGSDTVGCFRFLAR